MTTDASIDDIKELLYSKSTTDTDDTIISKLRRFVSETDGASDAPTSAATIFSTIDNEGYTLLEHAIAAKRTKVRFLGSEYRIFVTRLIRTLLSMLDTETLCKMHIYNNLCDLYSGCSVSG
jgi:hypothetical protein